MGIWQEPHWWQYEPYQIQQDWEAGQWQEWRDSQRVHQPEPADEGDKTRGTAEKEASSCDIEHNSAQQHPAACEANVAMKSEDARPSQDEEIIEQDESVLDPQNLFSPPLREADLPEDSSMRERLSKLLSAALRHKPQDFSLQLDADGFVDLEEVSRCRAFRKHRASPRVLAAVVRSIENKRFIFKKEGQQVSIAASHGHSQGVVTKKGNLLELTMDTAPVRAFHATKFHRWAGISETGLQHMDREYIHMAVEATQKQGLRQGQDLLIVVDTRAMVYAGIPLYKTPTNVLLTHGVTQSGILPLHFLTEIRNIHTGRPHFVPPLAGTSGSLWLEGRLPPMPATTCEGGPALWNEKALWSHIKAKTQLDMPHLDTEIHPTQLLVSFLAGRGLKAKVDDKVDVFAVDGEIWRGLRVRGGGAVRGNDTYYHGTHLYALPSIIKDGIKASTSKEGTRTLHMGEMPLEGVYCYTQIQQVQFYSPYILLPLTSADKPPCTVAVRISLELSAEQQANQRRGKCTNQYIIDEQKVIVRRIWAQAKSPDMLAPGTAYTVWQPALEAQV